MVFGDIFRQRADYTKGLFYSGRNGLFQGQSHTSPEVTDLIDKEVVIKSRKASFLVTAPSSIADSNNTSNNDIVEPASSKKESQETTSTQRPKTSDLPAALPHHKSFKHVLKFSATPKDHSKELAEIRQRRLLKRKTIVIDHTAQQEDWKLEVYGGVKMWVHVKTGEVSIERPKTVSTPKHQSHPLKSSLRQQMTASMGSFLPKRSNRVAIAPDPTPALEVTGSRKHLTSGGMNSSEKTVYHNPEMKELMAIFDAGQSSRKIRAVIGGPCRKIVPSV